MAYVPATKEELQKRGNFLGGLNNFFTYGTLDGSVPEKFKNRNNSLPNNQRKSGLANLGKEYKGDENAATIVAASYNPNAAGANPYVRDLLEIEIEAPKPPKPPKPDEDPRRGSVPAPSDPNNTGATGTQMGGLAGGSLSGGWSDEEFRQMLSDKYGIAVKNPFDSAPLPNTPRGDSQIRLENGQMTLGDTSEVGRQALPQDFYDTLGQNPGGSGFTGARAVGMDAHSGKKLPKGDMAAGAEAIGAGSTLPISGTQPITEVAAKGMEQNRAPLASGEDLVVGEDGYYGGGLSDRSRAFLDYDGPGGSAMALRAAEASQGIMYDRGQHKALNAEGEFEDVTKEGARLRASGKIGAQTLLDKYMQSAPKDALEKTLETGDPQSVSENQMPGMDQAVKWSPLSPSPAAGSEVNTQSMYSSAPIEGFNKDIESPGAEDFTSESTLNLMRRLNKI